MVECRWLTADDAAGYLRISTEGFRRKVRAGTIPAPSRALGDTSPRWDRQALDATMAGGVASLDPEEAAEALAQDIIARRRSHRPQAAR